MIGDFNGWNKGHFLAPEESRASGKDLSPACERDAYKYHVHRGTWVTGWTRPTPFPFGTNSPPNRLDRLGPGLCLGRSGMDGERGRSNSLPRPSPSTKFISGPGGGFPRRGSALDLPGAGPKTGGVCEEHGIHPRGVSSGHGTPFLRFLGLPDSSAILPRPAGTGRPRISCIWSTTSTSTGSA